MYIEITERYFGKKGLKKLRKDIKHEILKEDAEFIKNFEYIANEVFEWHWATGPITFESIYGHIAEDAFRIASEIIKQLKRTGEIDDEVIRFISSGRIITQLMEYDEEYIEIDFSTTL